jgi:hypothetical protein
MTPPQVAPGIERNRPSNGVWPGPGSWYEDMEYGRNTTMNIFFYGSRNVKKTDDYTYQVRVLSLLPVAKNDHKKNCRPMR